MLLFSFIHSFIHFHSVSFLISSPLFTTAWAIVLKADPWKDKDSQLFFLYKTFNLISLACPFLSSLLPSQPFVTGPSLPLPPALSSSSSALCESAPLWGSLAEHHVLFYCWVLCLSSFTSWASRFRVSTQAFVRAAFSQWPCLSFPLSLSWSWLTSVCLFSGRPVFSFTVFFSPFNGLIWFIAVYRASLSPCTTLVKVLQLIGAQ